MNRTDRLVALVMMLQSRRVTTAAQMAEHFEITERTVYRDIVALSEAGVPILGEAGVGYSLMRGYQLPPVMFSSAEALALVTGGLLAESMTDASVRESMRSALGKVTAVLPQDLQVRVQRLREAMLVRHRAPGAGPVPLSRLQAGMAEARVMRLLYQGKEREQATPREVEPLGLVYYLDHWHLIAWCRLRGEARDFRADRILECELSAEKVSGREVDLTSYLKCRLQVDPSRVAVLEVAPELADHLRRHWGPMVRDEVATEAGVRVTISYWNLDFLAAWLLGCGKRVRILESEALRERTVAMALEAAAHHREA